MNPFVSTHAAASTGTGTYNVRVQSISGCAGEPNVADSGTHLCNDDAGPLIDTKPEVNDVGSKVKAETMFVQIVEDIELRVELRVDGTNTGQYC